MKRKILLSLMLMVFGIFAFGMVSVSATTSGTCGKNIRWEFNAETLTISGTGEMNDYSEANEQPWYGNYFSIKKIIIENGVTSIGDYAFSGFNDLTDVTIPDSVTCIGECAFRWNKKMTSIKLPDSIDNIKKGAFQETGLTTITIPNRITTIAEDMFYGSELKNIEIPINVTSIEKSAFSWCLSLESVIFKGNVTSIGLYGFNNCRKLTSIILPNSLITIGEMAFNYCACLKQINIPSSVTSISNDAFLYCNSLIKITVDDNNTSYYSEDGVLYSKDKTKMIRYPAGKENDKFVIPSNVNVIEKFALLGCENLTTVTIPNSISNIDTSAFNVCDSLTNIYYNGTEEQWNKINISAKGNDSLKNATKIYFAYINLLDKDGNEISSKTQKMDETVDTSAITIPDGYALNLYKDKELTQEYLPDTPISENLTLYANFIEINKLKISGVQKADIGQKDILQSVTFATDKTAKYLVCTVKYPDDLQLKEISAKDFYVDEDMRETLDGYTYSYLTCTYKENGNIPLNKTLNPFDLIFDISENAKANTVLKIEILEDAVLSGDDTYTFDTIINNEITTNPILIQEMSIIGADEIDKAATYTVLFNPENATNKAVKWSVDDETVADVSESGTLTPIKSGTVVLKAASTDGSEVYAEKTVNVKVYAKISSITANTGVWNTEFIPETKEYIIYVSKNTTSIRLTAKHSGTLKSSDNKIFVNNVAKPISIKDDETNITLTYSCTGYTDSVYTLKILKFEGTKTAVSDDGKSFTIKPVNIAKGKTVIMALYDGDELAETQNTVCNGTDISFKTDKAYTNAKVMVWESLENIKPICDDEIVK